jgi:uncharacterized RDD family membrane protein YckC
MTNPYAPPQAVVLDIADPRLGTTPAERGTRLVASILDGLIFAGMVYLPMILASIAGGAAASRDGGSGTALGIGVLLLVVGFVAWLWLTIRYVVRNSQSIGKKIMHIKVVRSDGTPVTLGRLFWLRNVVNGLISIVPLYGLIDALFIFGESRQCLHDKIADTIVILE